MTPKQFFQRLQAEIKAWTWDGSIRIFGDSVRIVPELPIETIARWPVACAFLVEEGAINDAEHPILLIQKFAITIFIQNVQSAFGEGAMTGANRVVDSSLGAGAFDFGKIIIERLVEIITLTNRVLILERSTPKPQTIKGNYPLIFKSFSCQVLLGV